jgi:4-aminobutyrate aminotransferase-like enzyme
MGKGMASGLPIGAFSASREMMRFLSEQPKLGHITTFGGNPVIAAAALATLEEITSGSLIEETLVKEKQLRNRLKHPLIREIRGKGLMLALLFEDADVTNELVLRCASKGLILFWLLFEPKAVRISPPLTITEAELEKGCAIILETLDEIAENVVN